jgi:hypothetical protein
MILVRYVVSSNSHYLSGVIDAGGNGRPQVDMGKDKQN